MVPINGKCHMLCFECQRLRVPEASSARGFECHRLRVPEASSGPMYLGPPTTTGVGGCVGMWCIRGLQGAGATVTNRAFPCRTLQRRSSQHNHPPHTHTQPCQSRNVHRAGVQWAKSPHPTLHVLNGPVNGRAIIAPAPGCKWSVPPSSWSRSRWLSHACIKSIHDTGRRRCWLFVHPPRPSLHTSMATDQRLAS